MLIHDNNVNNQTFRTNHSAVVFYYRCKRRILS